MTSGARRLLLSLAAGALIAGALGLRSLPPPSLAQEAAPGPTPAPQGEDYARVRGITISCQTWGWEWGSDDMVEAMREVRELGANWVVIHPYARIRNDGEVGARYTDEATPPGWLTRPIREAHRLGLKIAIKPHLAYWGSRFSWRGEITFDDEADWERFFSGYEAWILRTAEMCADADAFVVGTELGGTVHHEARWRQIVAGVRERTQAPLTYAANWDRYQQVPFWDALDVIGVQAYFPLVSHDRLPTEQELERGWSHVLGQLEDYAAQQRRQVVFTELGYDRTLTAALRPWEGARRGADGSNEVQARCTRVALRVLSQHSTVTGAFLWKWFPGSTRGEDFLLSTPWMREVIGDSWR